MSALSLIAVPTLSAESALARRDADLRAEDAVDFAALLDGSAANAPAAEADPLPAPAPPPSVGDASEEPIPAEAAGAGAQGSAVPGLGGGLAPQAFAGATAEEIPRQGASLRSAPDTPSEPVAPQTEADPAAEAGSPAQAAGPGPASPSALQAAVAAASASAPLIARPPAGDGARRIDSASENAVTDAADPDGTPPRPADRPAGSFPAPVPEIRRTRDVIDRALAAGQDGSGQKTEAAVGRDEAGPDTRTAAPATTPAATIASSARPAPAVPVEPVPAAGALAASAESSTLDLPATQAAAAETRASEAAALSLSMTSRASIETTAQIAAQIVRKLEGRSTRFEMALTPEGLGQVDVSLDIDADGQLAARLAFDNPLAAAELRGRVDELRRQLQEAGFTVADDALSFSQRDASAGQNGAFDRRPDPRNARAFGAASRVTGDADLAAAGGVWIPLNLTRDRVDMKV